MRTPEQDLWDLLTVGGAVADKLRMLKGFGRAFRLLCKAQMLVSEARDSADETQRKLVASGKWPKLDKPSEEQPELFQ